MDLWACTSLVLHEHVGCGTVRDICAHQYKGASLAIGKMSRFGWIDATLHQVQQAVPGSLELLLHHVDVLTARGEVVETVWGIKHDLAASQAEQVFVGLALLTVQPGKDMARATTPTDSRR
jgi:hypothetical protein